MIELLLNLYRLELAFTLAARPEKTLAPPPCGSIPLRLQALFQFGWVEVGLFLVVLLPFAAASAVLMAVTLLPLVSVFNQTGEKVWHFFVPALAQNTLMLRVLKGESFSAFQVGVPLLVCGLLTWGSLWFVARSLRGAAVR